jgi:hypothetical protein
MMRLTDLLAEDEKIFSNHIRVVQVIFRNHRYVFGNFRKPEF